MFTMNNHNKIFKCVYSYVGRLSVYHRLSARCYFSPLDSFYITQMKPSLSDIFCLRFLNISIPCRASSKWWCSSGRNGAGNMIITIRSARVYAKCECKMFVFACWCLEHRFWQLCRLKRYQGVTSPNSVFTWSLHKSSTWWAAKASNDVRSRLEQSRKNILIKTSRIGRKKECRWAILHSHPLPCIQNGLCQRMNIMRAFMFRF